MPIFLIAVVVIIVIIVAGIVIAQGTAAFDAAVRQNRVDIENHVATGGGYNPALTLGFKIPINADYETQVREARRIAAKEAAAKPRGANVGIGRLGEKSELETAWKGTKKDPITAVKIAKHHGWDGLQTGFVVAPKTPEPVKVPQPGEKIKLVPGKDYPFIEITDDMSLSEKRKARIANAKAKSAAVKAAKAAGVTTTAAAPAPAAPAPVPAPAAASGIPEPELIEITDDMAPDEIRKARIANAKAQSAYKKALKAAGGTSAAAAPAPAPAPAAAPVPTPAAASGIPEPDLIEITDDMAPEEIRKARIANAKAKSAYKKALKAAGLS